jgi:hypothetical protein
VRSSLRLWSTAALAVAIGIGGCGGKAAETGTSSHTRTARLAPAYRAGQYCIAISQTKYRAAGFVCERHHLVRH